MAEHFIQQQLQLLETHVPMMGLIFYKNPLIHWLVALLIVLMTVLILNMAKHMVVRYIRRFSESTETDIDDFLVKLLSETRLFLMVAIGISLASTVLIYPNGWAKACAWWCRSWGFWCNLASGGITRPAL